MDPRRRAFVLGGGALLGSAALGAAVGRLTPTPVRGVVSAAPAASSLPAPAVRTKAAADVKRLFLHNLHTGDTIKTVYWENGAYLDGALAEARHALRDWRNDQQHDMDPKLFDVLHDLGAKLEVDRPFQIISGYRSPASNAAMHAASSGVAKNSLHMQGMASDIRVEGVELAHLRKAALSLGRGGVGFYPVSNFVHVDTGRVRQWQGA
jgi:uncharacterized protein YcbK (DUF882 family)